MGCNAETPATGGGVRRVERATEISRAADRSDPPTGSSVVPRSAKRADYYPPSGENMGCKAETGPSQDVGVKFLACFLPPYMYIYSTHMS